ncbi:MAG TPA: pyruvate carboxyltransferase [Desulfobulbus sp.]|nr:pyruvate carboxyltransferase [Desulfobulbus sp.]
MVMTEKAINIVDSTLREGEQTPGVRFTDEHRRSIIKHLHGIGIDEIELGVAAPSNTYLRELVGDARKLTGGSCRLGLWCRCREEDITYGALCRPDVLSLSIPTSDLHINERLGKNRNWIITRMAESIDQALSINVPAVSIGFEDASRADPEFLLTLAKVAERSGVCRIRLADTVGICTPETVKKLIQPLTERMRVDIGVHCHNDFGMATANSITALQAGARWIDATILGLGERAGNCRMEEVVGYLTLQENNKRYRPELLAELCRYTANVSGSHVPGNHPIVGENIFTCETGLHQHGLAVNPVTYEPYDPQRVASQRTLRFGGKTGRKAIYLELARHGFYLSRSQVTHVAEYLRSSGKTLDGEELKRVAEVIVL